MMTLIIPRKEAPVSGEGTVVIPQPAGDEPVIKNTFFFPDIDPKRVRERMRLEPVAPARLREAIKSGMAETNAELYEYREQKIAAGFTRLADVPADDIDGESIKVFYYERAVCAMATASLYERYRGVDASAKGDKKADSIDSTIDELWRDMRWAVAGIQDKPQPVVTNLMKTLRYRATRSTPFVSGITGALRAWSRLCSPQIRDWLNWVRCCRTAPSSNCPTFRPPPWLKLSICGSNA